MKKSGLIKREVHSREGVGLTASVIQRNDLFFHRFITDYPSFIFVRRGKKTLTIAEKKITILPSQAVAIAAGTLCDVLNETEDGQFESSWIVCADILIAEVKKMFPKNKTIKDAVALKGLGEEFSQSFERAVRAISSTRSIPHSIAENHVREVLIWLSDVGFVFNENPSANLQRKVRLLINGQPEKNWLAKDVADSFAMSEATFRRKLAEDGQSFNDILIDVRMTTALTLLQVTDKSVSEIAYQVGYESASRFAVRFKQRFGFSPTAIRGPLTR